MEYSNIILFYSEFCKCVKNSSKIIKFNIELKKEFGLQNLML